MPSFWQLEIIWWEKKIFRKTVFRLYDFRRLDIRMNKVYAKDLKLNKN